MTAKDLEMPSTRFLSRLIGVIGSETLSGNCIGAYPEAQEDIRRQNDESLSPF